MTEDEPQRLRVLIANERAERLERVAVVVQSLGHTVIARELDVDEVDQVTREERPDVALIGPGESSDHALGHISQIVREAACPVIALLAGDEPQPRGRLRPLERRGIDDAAAFALLRDHSQHTGG